MSESVQTIETLQTLRGLAATLILLKHAFYEVHTISPLPFDYALSDFFRVGVDIFFVLSGFIMVYISWGQSGARAARDFFVRRVIRIVPTYWFYTFLLLGVAAMAPQVLAKAEFVPVDFIKSLFFIPYINSAGELQPFLAGGWTLNYEMYFYALFALCLFFPPRIGIALLCGWFLLSVPTGFFGMEGAAPTFYSNIIVLEFLAGSLIGMLFVNNIRLPRVVFPVGVVFVVLSILSFIALRQSILDAFGLFYPMMAVGIMSVLLLALPRGSENVKMPRWSVFIGDASYSIYLSHAFGIGAVTQLILLAGLETALSPWLILAVTVGVSLAGGCIAYLLIEKQLIMLGRKITRTSPGRNYRHVERTA